MEYIKPEETIILNVLLACAYFSTCEPICISREVDITGRRTIAVVTKCEEHSKGVVEKVTGNVVNIGLGYVCVRNSINDETYYEVREQ